MVLNCAQNGGQFNWRCLFSTNNNPHLLLPLLISHLSLALLLLLLLLGRRSALKFDNNVKIIKISQRRARLARAEPKGMLASCGSSKEPQLVILPKAQCRGAFPLGSRAF